MHVIMVDRSNVTDRRIILEAKSLRKMGHDVKLLAMLGFKGTPNTLEGLPVIGFPHAFSLLDWIIPVSYQQTWKRMQYDLAESRRRLNELQVVWLPRLPKKIGVLFTMLRCPLAGLCALRDKDVPRWLAGVLGALLLPLTLDPVFIFLGVVFGVKAMLSGLGRLAGLVGAPDDQADVPGLDFWESKVFRYACRLPHIDILHAHDLPALRVAAAIKEKRPVPVIYDSHELYTYQPGVEPHLRQELFEEEKRLIRRADHVVVVNEDQAEIMRGDFGPHDFIPITNATEAPPDFDPRRRYDLIRARTGIPASAKVLLFQGIINRLRFIHFLLEGLAQARPDVHLAFMSWGKDLAEFQQMAEDLGLAGRVHFLPTVACNEMVYWAASADGGVMPYQARDLNTRISSPNKMYEFIAAATPMFGSSGLVNACKVVHGEGFGVMRELAVPADYAAAIDDLFDDAKGGSQRFKPNLLARRHLYLWEHEEKKLQALYTRLAVRAPARPASEPSALRPGAAA